MFVVHWLSGVLSGVLGGLGLGGGSVLIPLLSLFGVSQKSAQVINIFSFLVMGVFVVLINIKKNLVQVFPAVMFGLVGMLSAICFSLMVGTIDETTLKTTFGIFLLVVACFEVVIYVSKYRTK